MRASFICLFLCVGLQLQAQTTCIRQSFEGEVKYGDQYRHPIGPKLDFVLDPLPSGWLIRVLPAGSRPPHDYAELATPPYNSVTPLAISTDFSFRAQDAVAWNPRHFRFAQNSYSFQRMLEAHESYMSSLKDPRATRFSEARLTTLVQSSPQAVFRIVDSKFIAGTADQAGLAATVASHLADTPHTVEDARGVKVGSLGRLSWIRFRVDIDPEGGIVQNGPKVTACP